MDFVAKEKIVLALGSPLSIGIGVASGAIAFPFAPAGFMTKLAGIP
jgi:hypothetical protein